MVKNLPAMWETRVPTLGREDPLEEGMATHSSILAWRIPMDRRSLAGYSPWGRKETDVTEHAAQHRKIWWVTSFPLMEISCQTIVKYHNQDIYIDNQDTEHFHPTFIPPLALLKPHPLLTWLPSWVLGNNQYVLYFYNICHFKTVT